MRNDTKRRIRLYEEKLPYMKERLSAAGLGLLVAAIVTVSATFAWVTAIPCTGGGKYNYDTVG